MDFANSRLLFSLQMETVSQSDAEMAVLDVFKRDGQQAVKIFWYFVAIHTTRQTEIIARVKYNILVLVRYSHGNAEIDVLTKFSHV